MGSTPTSPHRGEVKPWRIQRVRKIVRCSNTNAAAHRQSRAQAIKIWAEVTGLAAGF
jgi:hypothetical protein